MIINYLIIINENWVYDNPCLLTQLKGPRFLVLTPLLNELNIEMSQVLNKYSRTVTQDPTQPAAQAMLYAIGFTPEDFHKPLVGIASTGYEGNPCNMHLNDLALRVKQGTRATGTVGLIFNTFSCVISYNHVDYKRLMNNIYVKDDNDSKGLHQSSFVKQTIYNLIIMGFMIG